MANQHNIPFTLIKGGILRRSSNCSGNQSSTPGSPEPRRDSLFVHDDNDDTWANAGTMPIPRKDSILTAQPSHFESTKNFQEANNFSGTATAGSPLESPMVS